MSRYSVRKPFTVLVAVVIAIALGVVSIMRLTTDLLPPVSVPFVLVITTYPGASPERVEAQVSEPLERALGTVQGVKNVYSVNAENFSMVQLEFQDGTNMDSAGIDISNALDQVRGNFPDGVGNPQMMRLSMDMMATMYVAVSHEDMDMYELSDFVRDRVTPYMERQSGVANVSDIGLVEKTIEVSLDQGKIDDVNDRILMKVNSALADAKKQLDDAEKAVADGRELLAEQEALGPWVLRPWAQESQAPALLALGTELVE